VQENLGKKTSKSSGQKPRIYPPRIFLNEFDSERFASFNKYRRVFNETEPQESEETIEVSSSRQKDLDRAVNEIKRAMGSRWKQERLQIARKRAKLKRNLLAQIRNLPLAEVKDFHYRTTFKQNLLDVISDFFCDPQGKLHLQAERLLVPSSYDLFGNPTGGLRSLKPDQVEELIVEALVWRARRAMGFLWALAENGQAEALESLSQCIVPVVKALNEKAIMMPKALGQWPQALPYWPVLKSSHRDFDSDHVKLLQVLCVGEKYPLPIGHESRWTARDAIGRWAIHLCQEIEIMQTGHLVTGNSKPWEKKMEKLQSLSAKSWKDWWFVAKGLLLHDYVDVVEVPDLNKTVRSKADRASPGRIRKRILQALRDKLKSMARENKSKNG
jgi:hypothetical protein